ncbi:MAG TPA: type II toxin-antitoxin system VapC family toxin [Solirubrobacteraceae bacterium]|nr:type II toxin-antitoxin system VapC family toxin [Solirubrobacteraceae bacterium]
MEAAPVLDSDVLIDHLRDAGPGRELVDELSATSGFRITTVTVFELALGRSYAREPAPADALMAAPCLQLTREAALRGGALLRELRAINAGIEIRDAMQAGICLEVGLPLVTRNVRHFARVPGLRVVEPGRDPFR